MADNKAFADKFDFNYPLLCDTSKAMSVAYGACADDGAKYPDRITYIIDAHGKIEHAEKVSDIKEHVPAAMARLNGAG